MADLIKTDGDRTFARLITPNVDVFQNADGYLVVADLPGTKKEELEVRVEGRKLTFGGPIGDGKFHREFQLPRDVNSEDIGADLDNGVLTLTLPKLEAARPRRIEIG
jgi:HSP20 family protein